MKIDITETKKVDVTPELLAKIFWQMDNDDQAKFFHELALIAGDNLEGQMEYVARFTDSLSHKALTAMTAIGMEAKVRLDEMQ